MLIATHFLTASLKILMLLLCYLILYICRWDKYFWRIFSPMLQFSLMISCIVINWCLKSNYLNVLKLTWCFLLILWTRTIKMIDFDMVSFEIDSYKLFLNLILLAWLKRFENLMNLISEMKLFKSSIWVLGKWFSLLEGFLIELYANGSRR